MVYGKVLFWINFALLILAIVAVFGLLLTGHFLAAGIVALALGYLILMATLSGLILLLPMFIRMTIEDYEYLKAQHESLLEEEDDEDEGDGDIPAFSRN